MLFCISLLIKILHTAHISIITSVLKPSAPAERSHKRPAKAPKSADTISLSNIAILNVSAATFTDVDSSASYASAIDSLQTLGIINGYEDDYYSTEIEVFETLDSAKVYFDIIKSRRWLYEEKSN